MNQITITSLIKQNKQVRLKAKEDSMIWIDSDHWTPDMGSDWIYLLFDIFQIRGIAVPFSEVSLDIVEFASKPTIYQSPVNPMLVSVPVQDGQIKFTLIRDPFWNKILFQIGRPVLAKSISNESVDFEFDQAFPLFFKEVKRLYLGPEGEVKILKS